MPPMPRRGCAGSMRGASWLSIILPASRNPGALHRSLRGMRMGRPGISGRLRRVFAQDSGDGAHTCQSLDDLGTIGTSDLTDGPDWPAAAASEPARPRCAKGAR